MERWEKIKAVQRMQNYIEEQSRIQLAPMGYIGYIEARPVRELSVE